MNKIKQPLLLLFLILVLINRVYAGVWSITLSSASDAKILATRDFRNLTIQSPATPWTSQAVFEEACTFGLVQKLAENKQKTVFLFNLQWDNPAKWPACVTAAPGKCGFTNAQKVVICQAAGRVSTCDMTP